MLIKRSRHKANINVGDARPHNRSNFWSRGRSLASACCNDRSVPPYFLFQNISLMRESPWSRPRDSTYRATAWLTSKTSHTLVHWNAPKVVWMLSAWSNLLLWPSLRYPSCTSHPYIARLEGNQGPMAFSWSLLPRSLRRVCFCTKGLSKKTRPNNMEDALSAAFPGSMTVSQREVSIRHQHFILPAHGAPRNVPSPIQAMVLS